MKRLLVFLLIVPLLFSCNRKAPQNSFIINGSIAGVSVNQVYLEREMDGKFAAVDTAKVDPQGQFVLKGSLATPEMVRLTFNDSLSLRFFLENTVITIKVDARTMDKAAITGSKSNDEYKAYSDTLKALFGAEEDSLHARYMKAKETGDKTLLQQISTEGSQLDAKELDFRKAYIAARPKSIIAPYILWKEISYFMEAADMEPILSSFDTALRNSIYVKHLNDLVEVLKKVSVGQTAPDFTLNDPAGKPVSLSSKLGKYLLVDFWASWCPDCRLENPNVVAAYKAFNKKGFDVLGVSLDRDSAKWVKAIQNDKLTWTHVSDLKAWNNQVAKLYGIRSIPSNLLLDQQGKIIAKNLTGETLQNKLKELLK